jgi:hypothetical protein
MQPLPEYDYSYIILRAIQAKLPMHRNVSQNAYGSKLLVAAFWGFFLDATRQL